MERPRNYIGEIEDSFSLKDVGSTLLEDLAKGLYQPFEVIREYIQNAVDAHRAWINKTGQDPEGPVQVEVSGNKISILDYGIGMDESEIRNVKAIAVSKKSNAEVKLTGYKGVGIWAGLSYFETITLWSTRQGSNKMYKLTIHFKKIVESIDLNRNIGDALNPNYFIEVYEEDPSVHYTIVTLVEPTRASAFFTDKNELKKAISEVCPCKIDPTFGYYTNVVNWYEECGFDLFDINLDGEPVYRTFPSNVTIFKTDRISINDVEVASCWYAVNDKSGKLTLMGNQLNGFRIIQSGFTLGPKNLYSEEYRTGFDQLKIGSTLEWYIGEIHVSHKELRPNLDRNEFEESELTRQFIKKIREWYKGIEVQTRVLSYERNQRKKYLAYEQDTKVIKGKGDLASITDLNKLTEIKKDLDDDEVKYKRNNRKHDPGAEIVALRNTTTLRRKAITELNTLIITLEPRFTHQEESSQTESRNTEQPSGVNPAAPTNANEGLISSVNHKPINTGVSQNSTTSAPEVESSQGEDDCDLGEKTVNVNLILTFLEVVLNQELSINPDAKVSIINNLKKMIEEVMFDV